MTITDYYKFERLIGTKGKGRLTLTASTLSYDKLEEKRATKAMKGGKRDAIVVGQLYASYNTNPEYIKPKRGERKADRALNCKSEHISSLYVLDPQHPEYMWGDVQHTPDGFLAILSNPEVINGSLQDGTTLELFICRGKADERNALFCSLIDGDLDEEIKQIRARATAEPER